MTSTTPNTSDLKLNDIAHAVRLTRRTLDAGLDELPYDISERLRAARVQALSQIKTQKPKVKQERHISDGLLGWLQRMPTLAKTVFAVPAMCLALIAVETTQQNVAAVSSPMALVSTPNTMDNTTLNIDAILKEQVPLQAYLDKDFNNFAEKDKQNNRNTYSPTGSTNHVQKNTVIQALH